MTDQTPDAGPYFKRYFALIIDTMAVFTGENKQVRKHITSMKPDGSISIFKHWKI
jgi:hypothetical protein